MENRNNKPGGMCLITTLKNKTKFIKGDADHSMIYTIINTKLRPKLKTDQHKLIVALEDGLRGKTNKDVYKYDRKWKDERNIKLGKENEKLVNPIANKLPLDPWYKLYKRDENKQIPKWYTPIRRKMKNHKFKSRRRK